MNPFLRSHKRNTVRIRANIDSILINRLCNIHSGKGHSYVVTRAVEYYVKAMEVEETKFPYLSERNKWTTRIQVDIDYKLLNQLHEIHGGASLSHAFTYAIEYYVEVMEVFMEAKKLEEKEVYTETKEIEEIKYQPKKLISANVDLELYNQLREMNREMNVSDCVRRAVVHYVECKEINKYIIEVDIDYDLSEQLIERYMGYSLSHVLTCAIVRYIEAMIRDEITEMNRYVDDGKKSVVEVRVAIIPDLINRLGEVHGGDSISEALNCAIKYYLELNKAI